MVNSWLAPSAIVGRCLFALPSGPPWAFTFSGPKVFLTVQVTGVGTPVFTLGSVTVAGDTVTPWTFAVRWNGLFSDGDVRRDSTSSSHTPGIGFSYARSCGLQAAASE